jgi:Uma2 family endonuclease
MAAVLEAPASAPENPLQKLWTRTEYRKLIDDGYLEDGKVELINGEIWHKVAHGRLHIITIMRVIKALEAAFDYNRLQSQGTLPLAGNGDPEPDLAVLVRPIDEYVDEEPSAVDTVLVLEVSNSTLTFDLTTKLFQYGSTGIPEYWVVDIPNRLLHVFREPTADGYASETVLTTADEVRPLAAPEAVVRVAELLP